MPTQMQQWLEARGWSPCDLMATTVSRQAEHVTVQLDRAVPLEYQPLLDQLAHYLSDRWALSVTFVEPSAPVSSWSERIYQVIADSQPALAALIGPDCAQIAEHRVLLKLPHRVAEGLFHKWGGTARLARMLPGLPPVLVEVGEAPDPDPAPAVAVIPQVVATHNRLGSGAPPEPATSLKTLPDRGDVVIQGRVVARDERVSRDGLRRMTWTVSDGSGAVWVRALERRTGPKLPEGLWPEGHWIKVRGTVEIDKFSGDRVVQVNAGDEIPEPTPEDPGAPRAELHAHTKMSAMDAVASPKDLFRWAARHGITAVAVVDHGVVQTYPELEQLAQATHVRPIYGVEINMVDTDVVPITADVGNLSERPIVVVDVETTGLSPRAHEVIEIGAVRLESGRIVDQFHRLIRPTRPMSAATRNITGIHPSELEGAASPQTAWNDFFAFADGAALAAHNARFDLGFLRWAREQRGQQAPWPVIDTLGLARAVLPGLKSYGLEPLADALKVPLAQHHRALADAEATAHILLKLLDLLAAQYPQYRPGQPLTVGFQVGRPTPVVVLVRNQAGLEALYRTISASHLSYFHRVPRVPRSLIQEHRANWWVGSPFHGGEITEALFRHAGDAEKRELAAFYDYWEVVPPDGARSLMREEHLDGEAALKDFLTAIIEWGQADQKPVVAVSDVHYLDASDAIFREVLAATAKGELHDADDALYFRTSRELEAAWHWLDPAQRQHIIYEAPQTIVAGIEPIKPVPSGLYAPKLEEAEKVVLDMPYREAERRYGRPLPAFIQERLDKEVRAIVQNGYASIYYIAHRLVQKSLEDGYLVGSRGSVGSSLVATLMRITEVNPLPAHYWCPRCQFTEFHPDVGSGFDLPPKACPQCAAPLASDGQDIPFETFLGFQGDKVPDIDLNFSGDYQPEIHHYTEVLFGRGHVFRAGTIATVAEKTAYGLVKAWARETGRDVSNAELEWLARGITGVKRTTGQHPGGLMVVPQDEDIHHFCPVQHPADDRSSDVITTHFDYHAIEGRLLKLDLLGHDDPTVIRMLQDLTGVAPHTIPFQDERVMSLFRDVDALGVSADAIGTPVGSLGIPEFGTRFVRQMLIETQPKTFAELIRISGLSHGTEVWTNNAQDLIRQRIATLSDVIATRDDIMLYLIHQGLEPRAAFGISESVRKGKGINADQAALMRAHGVPDWYIASCRKISYLFPKAHAAAYVMMGWRIAWFKVYHPLAYYAAYFSVRASDFEPEIVLGGIKAINRALADIEAKGNEASPKERSMVTVLEIAREMLARKFCFYPIDLERSHATRFVMEADGLLMPFAALPGLGVSAAQHIIEARNQHPFLSVDDLRQRAHLSKSVIDLLRRHGALKELGETSQLGFFL